MLLKGYLDKLFRPERKRAATLPDGIRAYVVGDIHGRDDLLAKLLDRIEDDTRSCASDVEVIFLGDYIDRGEESRQVVERCLALQNDPSFRSVFLKGNHEQAMLDFLETPHAARAWLSFGGLSTLFSYGVPGATEYPDEQKAEALRDALAEALPAEHLAFLQNLELCRHVGDYYFCHAGVDPDLGLAEQPEAALLWGHDKFFDKAWRENLCVVHGHYVSERVSRRPRRIGIDTGAYFSGRLTALRLEGGDVEILQT